ncbi:uncharacterized protein KIAA1755 homolog isoform X3 [Ranitomeya variabilis]|uniref:uncharacterized protein KIAA1755 homolog isoform X3 n=1 Tax=Ranitomeya variabilis TaxID=490064 RepID=UPI0040574C72
MSTLNKTSYCFIDFSEFEELGGQTSDLMTPQLDDTADKDLEGDYVDLLETAVTAENKPSNSCHQEMGDCTRVTKVNGDPISSVANNKWVCGRTQTSEDGVCTPCLRRKLNKDLNVKETKCRFRQSYLAALKNPIKFISAPMAGILEDTVTRSSTFSALESPICSRRKPQNQTSSWLFLGKTDSKSGDIQVPGASRNQKVTSSPGTDSSSPSLVHRFSFLKGQRGSSSSGDGLAIDSSSNQYGGTWRRVSAVCSPRLSRAKFSGKAGSVANTSPGIEVTSSVQKVPSKTGLWVSIVGSPSRGSIPWETITDLPIQCQDLSAKLLYSGIACLPGSRDKLGRAIIQVTTDSTAWDATWCSVREVARLLLYLFSVARKEIRDLGLMILVDARKHPPSPCLYAALQCAQASSPGSIQSTVVLVEKESVSLLDRMPGLQVEVLTSLKSLGRYVDIGQLTWDLGGTYPYCHSEWVQFYQKLDAFSADLRKASDLLQHAIQELGEGGTLQDSKEAEEKMGQYRELMKVVLSDSRLVSLQREGGTTLARLRKEATRFYCSQDVRSAVESAVQMYNHLEERVHALVTKSNRRLELLESILKIQELEKQFNQLTSWMDGDGENQLHEMDTMEWTLECLEKYHKKFKEFFLQATKEQFGLYAFYSKNKPQSDRLLQEHGAAFFKRKQQDLGDKMDLSSYLLKPIQRISKYSLLLQDMEWECKGQSTREAELKAAREVVRFQLRHGNDLLAMDDIQDCDVNLKEQGRLLRQAEFVISYRKRKCLRRVFLFEDLVLFSKTKKAASGKEIYVYKQSFKTSEIGLTHTLGGSGLCFEIWFRRRKLEDTYTFQAPSPDVKEAWTGDLQKILWDQAIKNREMRRQERAFSGLGCKPFTDIQPSEAAISSRAIPLTGNGEINENLHSSPSAALSFPTSPPPLRSMSVGSRSSASSAVSLGGCSSTSSGRGSLSPLHGCPGTEQQWRCCRTEPSQDKEPSIFLTASSGSSEGSVSGFSSPETSQIPVSHINACYPLECWRPLHVTDKPPENSIP